MPRYTLLDVILLVFAVLLIVAVSPIWFYSLTWGYYGVGLLLLLLFLATIPVWSYSRRWSYYPGVGFGFLFFLLLFFLLIGIL